jgi:sigma-B regulation protein RsbU (phosphoserine phosphatase)
VPDSDGRPEVLIVDDVPENVAVLGEVLRPHYRRKAALSGEKALEIATGDKPPDIILLDVMMPEMDGYEACRRLKADERTRRIPVIFVTAKGEVEDETAGFDVGAVDYITKPIIPAIVLARVKAQLELKAARETIERQNRAMLSDLRMARRVQLGLVPSGALGVPGLEVAFVYEPAAVIGGDLLDALTAPDGRTLFFVGDAMGHGVQAALVMAVAKSALRAAAEGTATPADILLRMNRSLVGLFAEHFVTAACCLVDPETGRAEAAAAGHAGPLWLRAAEHDVLQPGQGSLPLGLFDNPSYATAQLDMAPGDALVLYTDGIVEARNAAGVLFGGEQMRRALQSAADGSAQRVLDHLTGTVALHRGGHPMEDDLTVLVVRYTGGA